MADPAIDHLRPHANDEDDDAGQPASRTSGPAGSVDIAEAVRRLAERTREVITPAPEIALPPGATIASPEAARTEQQPQPELRPQAQPAPQADEPEPPVVAEEPPRLKTPEELERAGRVIAERVRSILNRAEATLEERIESQSPPPPPQAVVDVTEQETPARHADNENVREGLPDFDAPAEPMSSAEAARRRRLIDDTETFEPGRKPEDIFAEAERKARIVNGQSRRVGPISGRMIMHAPWIVVLVLSVIGFAIGIVEAVNTTGLDAGEPELAGMVLAVFGVMLVMSLYFLLWNRESGNRT